MNKFGFCTSFLVLFTALLGGLTIGCSSSTDDKPENPPKTENPEKPVVENSLVPSPKEGTIYGTWVNVWVSSSEGWWKKEDNCGLQTCYADGTWKAIDWNNLDYRKMTYENIKNAGVDFVITDNTNGLIQKTELLIDDLEREAVNLKFCVAFSSIYLKDENALRWLLEISKNSRYLNIDNMPAVVCYVTKEEWISNFSGTNNPILKQFYRVWASGEDTSKNKGGWQLEPEDGVGSESDFIAFVSPSVKHMHEAGQVTCWDRSIAMLDYTFGQARLYESNYIIAGSYDDYIERNGWLPLKTDNPIQDGPDPGKVTPSTGIQMFDPWTGEVAEPYLFYNRMKSWIKGEDLYHIPGGILSDGIYKIKKIAGKYLQAPSDYKNRVMVLGQSTSKTYDKFALYHLGNNKYRIVNVYTGKPLRWLNNTIQSADWTSADEGAFQLVLDNNIQEWELEPVTTFIKNESVLKCRIIMANGTPMLLD